MKAGTQLKGKRRKRWGELTDDELETIAGNREKLLGAVQARHALGKDEAERQLEEWQRYMKL